MKPPINDEAPEEGEILSDDLEDISDESMIFTPSTGKFVSRSDHLHALSLSSVSDLDEPPPEKRRKHRRSHSQKHARRRKRSRRKILDSDSSDNDTIIDNRLKLQLKAAVRIDVEEAHRNSLGSRLRAMVKSGSGPESETTEPQHIDFKKTVNAQVTIIDLVEQDATNSCVEIIASGSDNAASAPENVLEIVDSASEHSKEENLDSELMQLRIEALETAINNKFANRKKRKKDNVDDTNKENTSSNKSIEEVQDNRTASTVELPDPSSSTNTKPNVPPSPDEDEDVLRALLLASMSKKLTKNQPETPKLSVKNVQTKITQINQNKLLNGMKTSNLRANSNIRRALTSFRKVVNKASGATNLVKVPQVKPLIINVNSDSDSDWDLSSSPEKSPKKAQTVNNQGSEASKVLTVMDKGTTDVKNTENVIESTVEKFLKEQRAKVESEVQNVEKVDVESVCDLQAPETPPKLGPRKEKPTSSNQSVSTTVTRNILPEKLKVEKLPQLEKSVLKFLPASKREEYNKLQILLKMKKAEMKKPRMHRVSQKINETSKDLKISVINPSKDGELAAKDIPVRLHNVINVNKAKPIAQTASRVTATKANGNNVKVIVNNKANNQQNQISKNVIAQSKFAPSNLNIINNPFQSNIKTTSFAPSKKFTCNHSTQTTNYQNHAQLFPKAEAWFEGLRQQEIRAFERDLEKRNKALEMRATLKQLQAKKDGRLQIQEKYRSLRPLLKKLNNVNKEQKQCEQEVERLKGELSRVRGKQEDLYKNMLASINELGEKKKRIDVSQSKIASKPHTLITSTPIKPGVAAAPLSVSSSFTSSISGNDTIDGVFESNQSIRTIEAKNGNKNSVLDTWEQSTICNKPNQGEDMNSCNETDGSVVDPNDIDSIIKKTEERVAVLEKKESLDGIKSEKVRYVSPLDACQRRDALDPFAIMCPFEVNGTCKDPDCAYNHLPK